MPVRFVLRNATRRLLAVLAASAIALLLVGAGAAEVLAANPTLTVGALPGQDGSVLLTATAAGPAGTAVNALDVTFGLRVDFMGSSRIVSLGTATTDSSGQASLRYVPTTNGDQEIVATLGGDGGPTSAPVTIHVTGATPALEEQAANLTGVADFVFPAAVFVVLTVWALLIGTFLYAVLGIARPTVRAPWSQPHFGTSHAERDLGES